MTAYTLAHFSDPHLGPLPATGWRQLANKRLSGFFSWTRNRVDIHRPEVLKLLVEDLKRQTPDHIAITGDLVNISLPAEFRAAARWLESVGTPQEVTVIPGNHDAYVEMPWQESLGQWAPYMAGERDGASHLSEPQSHADFPFVRQLGDIALVGTSTAVPMPPFIAAGRLGKVQLERLRQQLLALGQLGSFRVVLIHHPPFGGGAYKRKSLLDAKEFQVVLAEAGAEMVLHGHTHVSGLGRIETAKGPIPVIGVPSASAVAAGHKDASRYHLYRISRQADAWRLDVDIRGLNAAKNGFEAQGSMSMTIPLLVSKDVPVAGAAA